MNVDPETTEEEFVPPVEETAVVPAEVALPEDVEHEDILARYRGTDELVGGVRTLDAQNRGMRATLEAQGYTFGEDGIPVAPVAVAAEDKSAAPATTAAGVAAAAVVAAPVPSEPAQPTEYKDIWTIRADGADLHEEAMEDPTSQEAADLIERVGAAHYQKLLGDYQRDKFEFGRDLEARDTLTVQEGIPKLVAATREAAASLREWITPGEGTHDEAVSEITAHYQGAAARLIGEAQQELAGQLMAQGMSGSKAAQRAAATVAGRPDLVQEAFGRAIVADIENFVKSVVALRSGGAPVKTAPAGAVAEAVAATTAASRPPAPGVGGSRGGGSAAPAPSAATKLSAGQLEIAKGLGYDPDEYAKKLRAQGTIK